MTKRKTTRGARAPQIQLSTPANTEKALSLISQVTSSDSVFQSYHDLLDQVGVDSTSPETFRALWRKATRAVESGGESKGAREAYNDLAEIVRRVSAGETLEAIEAERVRKLNAAHARRARASPRSGAPTRPPSVTRSSRT